MSTFLKEENEETDCPHKRWDIDKFNKGTCRGCGEERQYPQDGKSPYIVLKKGNPGCNEAPGKEEKMVGKKIGRHRFYEEHREAIVADLRAIGRRGVREKWDIPSATLVALEKRWLTQEERKTLDLRRVHRQEASAPAVDQTFPPFPEFSNTWPDAAQVAWLEAYPKLKGLDGQK